LSLGWRAGLHWIRTNTELLAVRSVTSGPTLYVSPWEVVDAVTVEPGDDLLNLPIHRIEEQLARHPRLKGGHVHRRWNGRIELDVDERLPVAVMLGNGLAEMDENGVFLGPPTEFNGTWREHPEENPVPCGLDLPLLTGFRPSGLTPGERVEDPAVRRAIAFLSRLKLYHLDGRTWISEIDVSDPEGLVLYTLKGTVPIRIGDGRVSRTKMRALFEVLRDLLGRDEPVRYVDLRFHDMIVVKKG